MPESFILVGNMYFLLVFGDDAENFLGPLRYIALLTLAAFVGDLLHIASAPNWPCRRLAELSAKS